MLNVLKPEEIDKAVAPVSRKNSVERDRMEAWLDERIAAGRKKPLAEVVTLTPVLAELLLERNPVNRPLAKYNMATIASDVTEDRFQFNGASIVVSNEGVLLDGQHRCSIVVQTGVPIQTAIVFGPKTDARFTIDIGRPKTSANFLHMKGEKYTAVLASSARMLVLYRRYANIHSGGDRPVPTKIEILDTAEQAKGLASSVEFVVGKVPTKFSSRSVFALCHYLIWKRSSRELADHFVEKVVMGDDLKKGDARLYCHNRLPALRGGGGSAINGVAEVILKSWNAYRRGESVKSIPTNGKLPKLER